MRNSFTLSYSGISDRLINDIKLSNNGISLSVKALWDTGATITCISPEIAKKLKLKPFGQVSVNNASGDDRSFIYRLGLRRRRFILQIFIHRELIC